MMLFLVALATVATVALMWIAHHLQRLHAELVLLRMATQKQAECTEHMMRAATGMAAQSQWKTGAR